MKNKKIPYYHYNNNNLMFIAGIYDEMDVVLLQKPSVSYLSEIHNRQPFF